MTHLPHTLMIDIDWIIGGSIHSNISEFENAVHRFHRELNITRLWNPAATALLAEAIRIEVRGGQSSFLEFESNNSRSFSEGELLFKISNALAEPRNKTDHVFFEGLHISNEQEHGKPPFYFLFLGS
jgi:hypothetical protein